MNLENELVTLQQELQKKNYRPGLYRTFTIYEPKKRMISAAPFRDRVVHHALCNIVQPLLENKFIYDSYANRKGKGTHKAVERYQQFCRQNLYALKCDIQKYFPSIDHELLKKEIRKTIGCCETLWLIDLIIDNSNAQESTIGYFPGDNLFTPFERRRGLPIGNLTSQIFANVYLNAFDNSQLLFLLCVFTLGVALRISAVHRRAVLQIWVLSRSRSHAFFFATKKKQKTLRLQKFGYIFSLASGRILTRCAHRNNNIPTNRNNTVGFRCVQDAGKMDARIRVFTDAWSAHTVIQAPFLSCFGGVQNGTNIELLGCGW